MISLNAGNTWSDDLLTGIRAIHNEVESATRVRELYGSIRDDGIGSARPRHRLPSTTVAQAERFIGHAHEQGIAINYTANVACLGSLNVFAERVPEVVRFLKWLEDVGVDRLTITHPLIMEIASQETCIPIEVSTVCHVDSLAQVGFYARRFRVDKICMSIYRNRDISFLAEAQALAGSLGVEIELVANEFCMVSGAPCIYRDSCYCVHGHGGNPDGLFGNYPLGRCMASRDGIADWLKAMFILPEDMGTYMSRTGIKSFKITGRTHPTEAMLRIARLYVSGKSPDNLLDLWVPLEHIGRGAAEYSSCQPFYIPAQKLIDLGFTRKWLTAQTRCSEICGSVLSPCDYCEEIARKVVESSRAR